MREILFRGKRLDNGEWVYGYYCQFHNRPAIPEGNSHQIFETKEDAYFCGSCVGGFWHIVDPSTVGQYTGLKDKNGKRIFEGDIVLFSWGDDKNRQPFYIEFVDGEFRATPKEIAPKIWSIRVAAYACDFEVVGNVRDNPELLKGESNAAD